VVWQKWDVVRQDKDGWLTFEEKGVKMQVQRHHGPGTLFFVAEGGDEGILEEWTAAPDVAFRLVDADGQQFMRVDKWDLQTEFHQGGGDCEEGFVVGIDGREVKFEIEEGGRQIRIEGEGMPKDWEGKQRGDLIVDLV
jgi:DnaJ-class molecular chaperone